jgi:N-terminal C2 in EEIG1 and EHBP1 proteins
LAIIFVLYLLNYVEVKSLLISDKTGLSDEDEVNVLFERGEKAVSTGAHALTQKKDSILSAVFNETLQLDATMYRDSQGTYQEKVGTLSVRQRKPGVYGQKKDSYKAVGIAKLQLHRYANSSDPDIQETLPLEWCVDNNARLRVVISCKVSDSMVSGCNKCWDECDIVFHVIALCCDN